MSNDTNSGQSTPDDAWSIATRVVSQGRPLPAPGAPVNDGITLSSTFHAGGELDYGRVGNPTWTALEETLANLEHARGALTFPAGQAAINAVLELVPVGGIVVAPEHPYSGTRGRMHELAQAGRFSLRSYRAEPDADLTDALTGAHLLWIESPTNPLLEISDIEKLSQQAHQYGTSISENATGAIVAMDATFATPYFVQPLSLGVDIVVHSATKYLAGHSDVLMGAIAANDEHLLSLVHTHRTLSGAIPGPFEAYLTLRGIRTLALRMEKSVANAGIIAQRLSEHPRVSKVRYPGLASHPGHGLAMATTGACAVISFDVASAQQAEAIADSTTLWVHATSIGGVESLIERRARWPFEHPDIPAELIRLSVGIEDVDDLWNDLNRAINENS
jgi:cystathionine gamma-synthase